jgi:acetyl esterase
MCLRWAFSIVAALAVLAAGVFIAFKVSPWPSVLLVRHVFGSGAVDQTGALAKHVPAGVDSLLDQEYGSGAREKLDVYRNMGASGLQPTIVWIHGGAFIAGDRKDVGPYLKILAAQDYTTVAVGYDIAPGGRYPQPVLQANAALAWLVANADRLNIDPSRIVIAGDSAGSQIAAQLSAGLSDPAYASAVGFVPSIPRDSLRAVALMCGVYSVDGIDMNGPFGGFLRTVLWSYFGTRDFEDDPRLKQFSVTDHIPDNFPPTFITVGNADPLAPQSVLIADAIESRGATVDRLFFQSDHAPPLPHEYQFNLDQSAGRLALDRLLAFLAAHSG